MAQRRSLHYSGVPLAIPVRDSSNLYSLLHKYLARNSEHVSRALSIQFTCMYQVWYLVLQLRRKPVHNRLEVAPLNITGCSPTTNENDQLNSCLAPLIVGTNFLLVKCWLRFIPSLRPLKFYLSSILSSTKQLLMNASEKAGYNH